MNRYLVQRLVVAVPTLLGVSVVVFLLARLTGDPTALMLPDQATAETRDEFRRSYGLDQPLQVQYWRFLEHALRGDLGQSIAQHRPVFELILERLPATLQLSLGALALAVSLGLTVGVLSAVRRGGLLDRVALLFVLAGQSIATFWLGIMLILIFAVNLRLLPVSGSGTPKHLVLPIVTLALFFTAVNARLARSSMLEVLGQDFVRTARAKGLGNRTVILRHALRASLIPIVTVVGLQFGNLLTGAIVTETVFAWPGVGSLVVEAILRRDYPIVQGTVILIAVMYLFLNLLVDLSYAYLDPRVRYD